MKHIELLWQSYLKNVVPKNADKTQIKETRQAFFSGAATLFTTIMNVLDKEQEEPTEKDLKVMEEINNEIALFGQELDKNILGITRH